MSTAAIRFVPFTEADFRAWQIQAIPTFALANVRDGRWTLAESIEKAKQAHDALLPQGLRTPGHFFMHLHAEDDDRRVGTFWWCEEDKGGIREAYVYDVVVEEGSRGQGLGRAAFAEFERVAREHGAGQLGLHVFGHNHAARRLYEALGFEPTSITLRKVLR